MSLQSDLFDKRAVMGATVQLTGNMLQNPLEDMTWAEVEEARREIAKVKSGISAYLNDIENCVIENATTWTKQWELAEKLYEPYKEDYNPNTIDKAALKAEFVEAGLEPEFATQLVISIADTSYDRYNDK